MLDNRDDYPDSDIVYFEMTEFKTSDIPKLWSFANRNDVSDRTLNAIQRWSEAMKNPQNEIPPTLKAIPDMVKKLIKNTEYKWMMMENGDGFFVPVLITGCTFTPPSRYNSAYVSVSWKHGFYFTEEEYDHDEKHKTTTGSASIYNADLYKNNLASDIESFDTDTMYDLSDLDKGHEDDYDDEDSGKNKKTKKKSTKTKREKLALLEILANEGLFMPTAQNLSDFFEHTRMCRSISEMIGKQFTCSTKASMYGGSSHSYWKYRSFLPMQEEGIPYRLVVDMRGLPSGVERQTDTSYAGAQLVPYWPYIRMYNLTKYSYVSAHVAALVPYKYNKDIIKNVVMDKKMKDYLSSIMGGEETYKDIVEGKSGGMIVLASGGPGLGKTLTAEAYSETMERPLYQIQSSQLGISIETIESELANVLRRAERWDAVLLIDECDTYVREREKDIIQNCIVGVFLRLLEYFNGVMFLTTNMHDIIDKAILSRCTSHIKFKMPSASQRKEMLHIHCRIQGVTISDRDAKTIADKLEMSGRDIRNMIKNIKKANHSKKTISVTPEMVAAIADYIPFIK